MNMKRMNPYTTTPEGFPVLVPACHWTRLHCCYPKEHAASQGEDGDDQKGLPEGSDKVHRVACHDDELFTCHGQEGTHFCYQ